MRCPCVYARAPPKLSRGALAAALVTRAVVAAGALVLARPLAPVATGPFTLPAALARALFATSARAGFAALALALAGLWAQVAADAILPARAAVAADALRDRRSGTRRRDLGRAGA